MATVKPTATQVAVSESLCVFSWTSVMLRLEGVDVPFRSNSAAALVVTVLLVLLAGGLVGWMVVGDCLLLATSTSSRTQNMTTYIW